MYNHKKLKQLRGKRTRLTVYIELLDVGLDICHGTYQSWEQGKTCPNVKQIDIIAKYFKVPITEFFK